MPNSKISKRKQADEKIRDKLVAVYWGNADMGTLKDFQRYNIQRMRKSAWVHGMEMGYKAGYLAATRARGRK